MNNIHFIYIPFTGVGLYGGYRGDKWFKDRIEVFKKYTLKSLANQTNKDFVVWLSFRPQEVKNPLTKEISEALRGADIKYILTFDGLMYWDDKFSPGPKAKLWNCGRVIRGCYRNKTWKDLLPSLKEILYNEKNSTLEQRLEKSLNKIKPHFSNVMVVCMSRIDSDDMFRNDYVNKVQDIWGFGAIVCNRGYIYNESTNELATWNPKTNPPFHTIIFPADVFFNAKQHKEYYGKYRSHEDVTKVFNKLAVLEDAYCVTTHNPKNQISTIWNHPFRGEIIKNGKEEILKKFGL